MFGHDFGARRAMARQTWYRWWGRPRTEAGVSNRLEALARAEKRPRVGGTWKSSLCRNFFLAAVNEGRGSFVFGIDGKERCFEHVTQSTASDQSDSTWTRKPLHWPSSQFTPASLCICASRGLRLSPLHIYPRSTEYRGGQQQADTDEMRVWEVR